MDTEMRRNGIGKVYQTPHGKNSRKRFVTYAGYVFIVPCYVLHQNDLTDTTAIRSYILFELFIHLGQYFEQKVLHTYYFLVFKNVGSHDETK